MSRAIPLSLLLAIHHPWEPHPARSVFVLPSKLSNRVVCAGHHADSVCIAPERRRRMSARLHPHPQSNRSGRTGDGRCIPMVIAFMPPGQKGEHQRFPCLCRNSLPVA